MNCLDLEQSDDDRGQTFEASQMPPKVEFEQIDEHGSMVHSVISCSLGFHGKGCCDPSTIGGYTLSFNRLYFFVLYSDRAFTWVRPAIHPSPVSVLMLTDTSSPHGCDASLTTVGSLSEGAVRVVAFPHIFVGYR